MMGAWIPPQADRGVPWAREVANVMAGQPKTSRIPTGGWRSYGAVPSNTYASGGPIEGTPYWSGLGMVGSVYGAFGQDTKTESPCPAGYVLDAATGKCVKVATEEEESTAKPWLDMISALGTAAATAYQSHQQYEIQKDLIKKGIAPMPQAPTVTQQGAEPAMQAGANGGKIPTAVLIGGGLALAALAFVALR